MSVTNALLAGIYGLQYRPSPLVRARKAPPPSQAKYACRCVTVLGGGTSLGHQDADSRADFACLGLICEHSFGGVHIMGSEYTNRRMLLFESMSCFSLNSRAVFGSQSGTQPRSTARLLLASANEA